MKSGFHRYLVYPHFFLFWTFLLIYTPNYSFFCRWHSHSRYETQKLRLCGHYQTPKILINSITAKYIWIPIHNTIAILFSNIRRDARDKHIQYHNHDLSWSETLKYLGCVLGAHLTFNPHIPTSNKFRIETVLSNWAELWFIFKEQAPSLFKFFKVITCVIFGVSRLYLTLKFLCKPTMPLFGKLLTFPIVSLH